MTYRGPTPIKPINGHIMRRRVVISATSNAIDLTLLPFAGKLSYSKNIVKGGLNLVVANHTRLGVAFTQASRKNTPERPNEAAVRKII